MADVKLVYVKKSPLLFDCVVVAVTVSPSAPITVILQKRRVLIGYPAVCFEFATTCQKRTSQRLFTPVWPTVGGATNHKQTYAPDPSLPPASKHASLLECVTSAGWGQGGHG